MNLRRWCRFIQVFTFLSAFCLVNAQTPPPLDVSPTPPPLDVSATTEGSFSSATPAPGGTEAVDITGVSGTPEAATEDSTAATVVTEATTVITEAPTTTTQQPVLPTEGNSQWIHLLWLVKKARSCLFLWIGIRITLLILKGSVKHNNNKGSTYAPA